MNFALTYLIYRFAYRVGDFFHHWYYDGSRNFFHGFISFLESLDRTFAVRLTLKFLFHPLYKDYTIVGRILGFIFRSGRILIGVVVYAFFAVIFFAIYLAWLLVPPALILYAAAKF
ncbi:MAG TPA: hypothetical protein VNG29_00580 [Candidatus Paceibacterota bacterium]|nr:hypothetical protein [Candidatus Paceibacterota bacterium]